MQTREQMYAARVYAQVSGLSGAMSEEDRKKYGAMAHKLPILIRSAGLAQALVFVKARSEEPPQKLLEHLAATVGAGSAEMLLRRSREDSLLTYMRLTHDVLAALLWYKRFAQSVLGVDATTEDGGGI